MKHDPTPFTLAFRSNETLDIADDARLNNLERAVFGKTIRDRQREINLELIEEQNRSKDINNKELKAMEGTAIYRHNIHNGKTTFICVRCLLSLVFNSDNKFETDTSRVSNNRLILLGTIPIEDRCDHKKKRDLLVEAYQAQSEDPRTPRTDYTL